jgi:hypothetical protein
MVEAYEDIAPHLHALRLAGRSLRATLKALNDVGHTTRRGRSWTAAQVSQVLMNL